MTLLIVLLVLAVILGGVGFAVHAAWIAALVFLVVCGVLYLMGVHRR